MSAEAEKKGGQSPRPEQPQALVAVPKPLLHLDQILEEKFRNDESRPESKLTPVGAVIFGQRKRMVLLAVSDDDRLRSHYFQSDEEYDPEKIVGIGNRVHDLSDYDEVDINQVSLAKGSIYTFESVETRPSVALELPVRNSDTNKRENFVAEEDEILNVFSGDKASGGIMVFKGGGYREHNALIIDRQSPNFKKAELLFFQDEEVEGTKFDSVIGLRNFLQVLNIEFDSKSPTPLQTEALASLDRSLIRKQLEFVSGVRKELFRTMVIANARLFEKTDRPEHLDFLEKTLPDFQKNPVSAFLVGINESALDQYNDRANDEVDSLIYNPKREHSFEEQLRNTVKETVEALAKPADYITTSFGIVIHQNEIGNANAIANKLSLQESFNLRKSIPDMYYGIDKEPMQVYMQILVDYITKSGRKDEFQDAETLLLEAMHSDYVLKNSSRWLIDISKGKNQKIWKDLLGNSLQQELETLLSSQIAKRVGN